MKSEPTRFALIATDSRTFISSTSIKCVSSSLKKAQKHARRIVNEIKNTIWYYKDSNDNESDKKAYIKTLLTLSEPAIHRFVEKVCLGLIPPGDLLDSTEKNEDEYFVMFGVAMGRDKENNLIIEIGCIDRRADLSLNNPQELTSFIKFQPHKNLH